MYRTVLTTPFITPVLRGLAVLLAKVFRWKIPSSFPDHPKAILIGAPHTSNWDFVMMLMTILVCKLDVNWVGKHTLFAGPLGPVMRWLGGIPIDRTVSSHFVDQIVAHFEQRDHLWLVIAPEGTRKPVPKWRSGFYHMAYNAHVPIILSYLDYQKREMGIGSVEIPSGNVEEDIARYQAFYAGKAGKIPHNYHGYQG